MSAAPSRKSGGFSALDTVLSPDFAGGVGVPPTNVRSTPPPDHTSGRSTEEKEAS